MFYHAVAVEILTGDANTLRFDVSVKVHAGGIEPSKKGLVRFINEHVKSRESFRPFAPSVLAEEAANWFDLGENAPEDFNTSPYMSMTAMVHDDKRKVIPAVTHVDGSSRLQTVTQQAEPFYHQRILFS